MYTKPNQQTHTFTHSHTAGEATASIIALASAGATALLHYQITIRSFSLFNPTNIEEIDIVETFTIETPTASYRVRRAPRFSCTPHKHTTQVLLHLASPFPVCERAPLVVVVAQNPSIKIKNRKSPLLYV